MITKLISFTVLPTNSQVFAQALRELEKASRAEQGCHTYTVYHKDGQTNCFFVFEIWVTENYLEAHRCSTHVAAFKTNCGHMILEKSSLELTSLTQENTP